MCQYRGHFTPEPQLHVVGQNLVLPSKPFCHPSSEKATAVLTGLRAAFEEVADRGRWTRFRRLLGGLGFYPPADFALNEHHVVNYDALANLPVLEAARKVRKQPPKSAYAATRN